MDYCRSRCAFRADASSITSLEKTQEQFDAITGVRRGSVRQAAGPTVRDTGAACVASGLPAERSTCI